jgi:precorrin-6A/cobalt-precorrin-6A reductase
MTSSSPPHRVLLLGGTGEARELASVLNGVGGFDVVSSLAGRVTDPRLPAGESRVGGFGGAAAMGEWLAGHGVRAVLDATHPFAERITAQAAEAARLADVPLLVLRRPGWRPDPGDDWHWVPTLADAAEALSRFGSRVFLTTGRQEAAAFAHLSEHEFVLRCVQAPEPPLPPRLDVLLDRGPFTVDGEVRLLSERRIDVLVTKDSGGAMTSAKLAACRRLGLPVIIVRRPPLPDVPSLAEVGTVEAAVDWLRARFG